jgi:Probable molybdopterin binding domain
VKVARIAPGRRAPRSPLGAVLARDLVVAGDRWSKGRRLSDMDLDRLGGGPGTVVPDAPVTVLVLEPGDIHEDDAALRLARAIGGRRLRMRGPVQSRVDLVAERDGVLHVRSALLERLNRIDPIEAFTAFDGSVVAAGDLVASVKVAPHVVAEALIERAEWIAAAGRPVVEVAPYVAQRIGVIVKESIHAPARDRFEESVRTKVESLGSGVSSLAYVGDDEDQVENALRPLVKGRDAVDLVLTAGGGSTDPDDAFFVAIERLGGRIVRRGVPAHPGSMLWLGRIGHTGILGLPTCGAYSKATAADLLLPRLLSGEPVSPTTVAKLGHGGILTRDQRFRFPPYARNLDAPEG